MEKMNMTTNYIIWLLFSPKTNFPNFRMQSAILFKKKIRRITFQSMLALG